MLFIITGTDVPDSLEKRMAARPAHLARLDALAAEGRLLIAGPCPLPESDQKGFSGSVIIAEFDSLSEAEIWAQNDPYILENIFSGIIIKPFLKVYPKALF